MVETSSPNREHVCLVTPGHLSTNPRLVKEARALSSAGYTVSVVAARFLDWADRADNEFDAEAWNTKKIAFGPIAGRSRHFLQSARRRVCDLLYRSTRLFAVDAFHPASVALNAAASSIEADLYIAHNLAALPAAYYAARKYGAKLAFDAEDFHRGEIAHTPENAKRIRLVDDIERRFLPSCDYVSAASFGIAESLANTYGIPLPSVFLNVFSLQERSFICRETQYQQPNLYWFSQTIGPSRGLETAIEAIARSRTKPILYLRGNVSEYEKARLLKLAASCGATNLVRFLDPARPAEMIPLASCHGAGLASEGDGTQNRELCLSNKVFTYLMAGIPVIASDTPEQLRLAQKHPEAFVVYERNRTDSLAFRIDELFETNGVREKMGIAALDLATTKYNWELVAREFLAVVRRTLDASPLN